MQLKVNRCPSCGYSIQIEEGTRSLICPSCGCHIIVEAPTNQSASATQSTSFIEPNSGQLVGTSIIPAKWLPQAEIHEKFQSLSRPLTIRIQASSPDGAQMLFATSGEAFHQIKSSILQKHQEGQFDERTKTPMRTFLPPQQYLDQMATIFITNQPINPLGTHKLSHPSMDDLVLERKRYTQEAKNEFNRAQTVSGGSGIELQNVFIGGLTRVYSFSKNGKEHILLLGAIIKGLEYAYQLPGSALFNGLSELTKSGSEILKNLPHSSENKGLRGFLEFGMQGGLIGAKKRQQKSSPQPTTSPAQTAPVQQPATAFFGQAHSTGSMCAFVDWESSGVYGMLTPAPLSAEAEKIYNTFVRSFMIDPAILARMKAISQQITSEMQRQQQQQFAAQQQAYHTQQATFDSANQAWWNRTQRQDAARRFAYQSRMDSEDRIRNNYSEAIRGVNTYSCPDGGEVEYSISADRVFMKDGEPQSLRSASFGEDIPFGWTELKRKSE